MPGPRDDALILRDGAIAGALVGDETLIVTLDGGVPMTKPLAVYVRFPVDPGAAPDVAVVAYCVTASHEVAVTHTVHVIGGTTVFPFLLILPLPPCKGEDWEVLLDVSAGNWDAVDVWLEAQDFAKLDVA